MASNDYRRNNQVKFVNPYNFVRLSKGKSERTNMPDYSESNEKLVTGKLHCALTTKTPLAIPDTELVKKDTDGHPTFTFYSVDGEKRIPGSTIRGCIRSTYETLTDSCFVTMAEEMWLTNRVDPGNAYSPGLLIKEENNWVLYNAKRLYVQIKDKKDCRANFSDCAESERCVVQKADNAKFFWGDAVDVVYKDVEMKNGRLRRIIERMKHSAKSNYYVYVGEPIGEQKYYQSVFHKREKISSDIKLSIQRLEYSWEIYKDNKDKGKGLEDHHTGYAGYERAKKGGVVPIWYKMEGDSYSLSFAAVGRRVYSKSANAMIGEQRTPCLNRQMVCQACQLFGMAKEEGIGSRIRISDASLLREGKSTLVMLKELGSPRTGYFPFYSENGLEFYEQNAMISGRKYYWHIPDAEKDASIYTESNLKKKSERNATVEVLSNAAFEFDVYFDRISPAQLEELKWVITLGENRADGNLCHKIGHGKPLGLGSVKMTILEECIRNYDERRNYSIQCVPDTQIKINETVVSFHEDALEQILAVCSFDRMKGKKVCYPFIDLGSKDASEFKADDNRIASHQWFTQNKSDKYNMQVLHKVTDENQALSAYSFGKCDTSKGTSEKTEEQNFSIGEVCEGTVLKPKNNPKYCGVKLKTGKIVSIWNGDNKFAEGDSIKVKYRGKKKGKDGREYDYWERQ